MTEAEVKRVSKNFANVSGVALVAQRCQLLEIAGNVQKIEEYFSFNVEVGMDVKKRDIATATKHASDLIGITKLIQKRLEKILDGCVEMTARKEIQ